MAGAEIASRQPRATPASARVGRLAWLAPALSVVFGAAALVLEALASADKLPVEERLDIPDVLLTLALVAYAAVGALIAARHPRNPVGWLFCVLGVGFPANTLLAEYVTYGLVSTSGGLPGQGTVAWLYTWSYVPLLLVFVPLLLLFPNGRFLSNRWRLVALAAVGLALLWTVALALDPGPLNDLETVSDPLAGGAVDATIATACSGGFAALVAAALLSVVVRYRRAEVTERQQIKWLAAAAGFAALMELSFVALVVAADTNHGPAEVVTSVLAFLAWAAIPIAAGIAILRHRLYDIDVVINRTLVYGALTLSLAGAYVGSVLLLQLALSPLTAQSDLAIAGSTLAVAALFRPARARIQELVDRRFYRRKYDAARTLEAFSARLRDEVDLDALNNELRAVVRETIEPAHVSLWLRAPGERL